MAVPYDVPNDERSFEARLQVLDLLMAGPYPLADEEEPPTLGPTDRLVGIVQVRGEVGYQFLPGATAEEVLESLNEWIRDGYESWEPRVVVDLDRNLRLNVETVHTVEPMGRWA